MHTGKGSKPRIPKVLRSRDGDCITKHTGSSLKQKVASKWQTTLRGEPVRTIRGIDKFRYRFHVFLFCFRLLRVDC
jgi:hypothetical protein